MSRYSLTSACYDWITEFACHDLWNRVVSQSELQKSWIEDLCNEMMGLQQGKSKDIKSKELVFLNLTCSLANTKKLWLHSYDSCYDSLINLDYFKYILQSGKMLSQLCQSQRVHEKFKDTYKKAILQKIFVSLFHGKYRRAQAYVDEAAVCLSKADHELVQGLILAKKKPDLTVQGHTLEDFITSLTDFLDAVYHTFDTKPFLMKIAENYFKISTASAQYTCSELQQGVSDEVSENNFGDGEEEALMRKLQDIRKKKRKEALIPLVNNSTELQSDSGASEPGDHMETEHRTEIVNGDKAEEQSKPQTDVTDSENPAGSQSDGSSAAEEENVSLQSRVPFEKKHFHKRYSLKLQSKSPPKRPNGGCLRMKWTVKEEKEFYKAVQIHGVGNWHSIQLALKTNRTNVQLKDKWRTISRTNYDQLCAEFGPV